MSDVVRARRFEVWSTWAAGGGTRLAFLPDPVSCRATRALDGSDRLDVSFPLDGEGVSSLAAHRVLRVDQDDTTFDEWAIVEGPTQSDVGGTVACVALPLRSTALANRTELVRRIDSDGVRTYDFEDLGVTATEILTRHVLTVLGDVGMTWITIGTIETTRRVDIRFAWDTPLAAILRVAELTDTEFSLRRTPSGYAIDLLAETGSTAPVADIRDNKNIDTLLASATTTEHATAVFPRGAAEDGQSATMARATWRVTAVVVSGSNRIVTLADPAGGPGPIQFNSQLVGRYLRTPTGVLHAILASSSTTQQVTVQGAAALAIDDTIQFRAGATGADLTWLESPGDRANYGFIVRTVDVVDVPATNNLVRNAVLRTWPGAGTTPPTSWSAVGTVTLARRTVAPYYETAGQSLDVSTTAAGAGVQTAAVPVFPTANAPYVSGYLRLWVISGTVRVELVATTPSGTVAFPNALTIASNQTRGQWESLGVSGIDLHAIGATAAALRVVQHGATAAQWLVDAGQLTESAAQQAFVDGSGGTRLWQAANEHLRTNGAPIVSYDVTIADLVALDPATWDGDCTLVLGGRIRLTSSRLGVQVTTRLISYERDYVTPGLTRLTVSNKPDDLISALAQGVRPPRLPASVAEAMDVRDAVMPTVRLVPSENADHTVGTLDVYVTADPQQRASGVRFWTTDGRTITGPTTPAPQPGGFWRATVPIANTKSGSTIEWAVIGTDASGVSNQELLRDRMSFGVGTTPLAPRITPSVSIVAPKGRLSATIQGDSDTKAVLVLASATAQPSAADTLASGTLLTTTAGRVVAPNLLQLATGGAYFIAAVALNANNEPGEVATYADTWDGIGATPSAEVLLGAITVQQDRASVILTPDAQCQEIWIWWAEHTTNPTGTPTSERATPAPYLILERGAEFTPGTPVTIETPFHNPSYVGVLTVVAYDPQNQRGVLVNASTGAIIASQSVKIPGAGGSAPPRPAAPTVGTPSVTANTITVPVTPPAGCTTLRPYVDGVARADVTGLTAGSVNPMTSTGFLPATTHTLAFASVTAAGVSDPSATVTATTASGGGSGGTGSDGKVPTPTIAGTWSRPDQAARIVVTPAGGTPSGTVWRLYRSATIGGTYTEVPSAASTATVLYDELPQGSSAVTRHYRVKGDGAGYLLSEFSNIATVTMPGGLPD